MNTKQNIEDHIDLKELFFSIIAHWLLILICIVLSLFIALMYLRVTPNTTALLPSPKTFESVPYDKFATPVPLT